MERYVKKPKAHKHCWHYQGGWTNGMSSYGEDNFQCCFCGVNELRAWESGNDPKHGGYAGPHAVKIFKKSPAGPRGSD